MEKTKEQQKPVAKFRAGLVSAALWENQVQVRGNAVKMLKATVQRRFKDRDGEWKSTQSFGRNEIPLAIHCLQQAFERMIADESSESDSSNNANNTDEESVD